MRSHGHSSFFAIFAIVGLITLAFNILRIFFILALDLTLLAIKLAVVVAKAAILVTPLVAGVLVMGGTALVMGATYLLALVFGTVAAVGRSYQNRQKQAPVLGTTPSRHASPYARARAARMGRDPLAGVL